MVGHAPEIRQARPGPLPAPPHGISAMDAGAPGRARAWHIPATRARRNLRHGCGGTGSGASVAHPGYAGTSESPPWMRGHRVGRERGTSRLRGHVGISAMDAGAPGRARTWHIPATRAPPNLRHGCGGTGSGASVAHPGHAGTSESPPWMRGHQVGRERDTSRPCGHVGVSAMDAGAPGWARAWHIPAMRAPWSLRHECASTRVSHWPGAPFPGTLATGRSPTSDAGAVPKDAWGVSRGSVRPGRCPSPAPACLATADARRSRFAPVLRTRPSR